MAVSDGRARGVESGRTRYTHGGDCLLFFFMGRVVMTTRQTRPCAPSIPPHPLSSFAMPRRSTRARSASARKPRKRHRSRRTPARTSTRKRSPVFGDGEASEPSKQLDTARGSKYVVTKTLVQGQNFDIASFRKTCEYLTAETTKLSVKYSIEHSGPSPALLQNFQKYICCRIALASVPRLQTSGGLDTIIQNTNNLYDSIRFTAPNGIKGNMIDLRLIPFALDLVRYWSPKTTELDGTFSALDEVYRKASKFIEFTSRDSKPVFSLTLAQPFVRDVERNFMEIMQSLATEDVQVAASRSTSRRVLGHNK